MSVEPDGRAPSPLVYVGDHGEQAWSRLPSRMRDGRPRLEAFTRALGEGAQVLEDALVDLIDGRRLEDATGAALDQWGAVVGEARGGLSDADYRRFVSARILVNSCKGDVESILAVWAIIVAPWSFVRFRPMYPSGYELIVVRSAFLADGLRRRVRRMMDDVRPAAATGLLIEAIDGYVGFDGDGFATGFDSGPLARVL